MDQAYQRENVLLGLHRRSLDVDQGGFKVDRSLDVDVLDEVLSERHSGVEEFRIDLEESAFEPEIRHVWLREGQHTESVVLDGHNQVEVLPVFSLGWQPHQRDWHLHIVKETLGQVLKKLVCNAVLVEIVVNVEHADEVIGCKGDVETASHM